MNYPVGRLGDFVAFSNGRSSPERIDAGQFKVFGSNGPIGRSDERNAPPLTAVIGRVGTYCGSVHFAHEASWVTDNAIKAVANEQDEGRFWYYALLLADLGRLRSGSGQPLINQRSLNAVELPVPPRSHRLMIADILGSLDDKIELNRQVNETLEVMAQAIFRDWFVAFGPTHRKIEGATDSVEVMGGLVTDAERAQQLADLFPARFGDNGLPGGWEETPFGELIDVVGGGTPKTSVPEYWGGDIPWFSVVDTPPKGAVYVDLTEKSITAAGLENSSARLIEEGTTIISARGTVGNLAIAAQPMTFNQSCYALKGKAGIGNFFVFLASQGLVERLKGMAHGSVFSTITRATFDSITYARPAEAILSSFEQLAEPLFRKIKANVAEQRTLAVTRDLLLPRLMSGEIRLPEAAEVLEAAQ